VDILDGKRHDKSAQVHHLGRAVYLLSGGKHWGWLSFPGEAETLSLEVLNRADAMFLNTFRALVNQWIDSGIEAEIESPLTRDIRKVPPGLFGSSVRRSICLANSQHAATCADEQR
jgi:hypothetical protein